MPAIALAAVMGCASPNDVRYRQPDNIYLFCTGTNIAAEVQNRPQYLRALGRDMDNRLYVGPIDSQTARNLIDRVPFDPRKSISHADVLPDLFEVRDTGKQNGYWLVVDRNAYPLEVIKDGETVTKFENPSSRNVRHR